MMLRDTGKIQERMVQKHATFGEQQTNSPRLAQFPLLSIPAVPSLAFHVQFDRFADTRELV